MLVVVEALLCPAHFCTSLMVAPLAISRLMFVCLSSCNFKRSRPSLTASLGNMGFVDGLRQLYRCLFFSIHLYHSICALTRLYQMILAISSGVIVKPSSIHSRMMPMVPFSRYAQS